MEDVCKCISYISKAIASLTAAQASRNPAWVNTAEGWLELAEAYGCFPSNILKAYKKELSDIRALMYKAKWEEAESKIEETIHEWEGQLEKLCRQK